MHAIESPEDELDPQTSAARRIATAMRTGALPPDPLFDAFLPEPLRLASAYYWTPLPVAARIARWVAEFEIGTVLDIGSGAGKFCVAAALAGPGCYLGLERRPRLVVAARELARRFEVEARVCFLEGSLGDSTTPVADAYYLYNPFGEHLYGAGARLDDDIEPSRERYDEDVALVEALLRAAPVGTFVIVYNGFGGHTPATYRELRVDRTTPCLLRLLRKSKRR